MKSIHAWRIVRILIAANAMGWAIGGLLFTDAHALQVGIFLLLVAIGMGEVAR